MREGAGLRSRAHRFTLACLFCWEQQYIALELDGRLSQHATATIGVRARWRRKQRRPKKLSRQLKSHRGTMYRRAPPTGCDLLAKRRRRQNDKRTKVIPLQAFRKAAASPTGTTSAS